MVFLHTFKLFLYFDAFVNCLVKLLDSFSHCSALVQKLFVLNDGFALAIKNDVHFFAPLLLSQHVFAFARLFKSCRSHDAGQCLVISMQVFEVWSCFQKSLQFVDFFGRTQFAGLG